MPKTTSVTVKDVTAADFIAAYAAHLKRRNEIELPEWVDIVKTGVHKELSPYDRDWFYIRAAATARRLYIRPGAGVGAFRKIFGGAQRNGVAPNHFRTGSGAVARRVLQQLEKLKVVKKDEKNGGRILTSEGRSDMDKVAQGLFKPHSFSES